MVQSPSWEANWFAASQEIPRIWRNPKVHYCTHKRPPPVSILGQPNPVYIPTSHLLEIHPNIIHPSTPRSPHWSPFLRFPHQDPAHPLSSPIRATCPAHLILLDFITRTILGEEYNSFSSSLCSLLHFICPLPFQLILPFWFWLRLLLTTFFVAIHSFRRVFFFGSLLYAFCCLSLRLLCLHRYKLLLLSLCLLLTCFLPGMRPFYSNYTFPCFVISSERNFSSPAVSAHGAHIVVECHSCL